MNNRVPLLQVQHVTVRFGGLTALNDVSFEVFGGELLGLIGPNGAGKTTILRAITGVVKPITGNVVLDGNSLNGLAIHQRIRFGLALSQQLVRPFRELSLIDNVALAAGAIKTEKPWRALMHRDSEVERARARILLEKVGIADLADEMPSTQPLGVLKRLEMVRALALNPRLLLLDEPLAGLNSHEARALAETIQYINSQGVTVVLIEHNLGEVMRVCSRLIVLDNGAKIAQGEPATVMSNQLVRAAYLGSSVDELEAVHA